MMTYYYYYVIHFANWCGHVYIEHDMVRGTAILPHWRRGPRTWGHPQWRTPRTWVPPVRRPRRLCFSRAMPRFHFRRNINL